MESSDEETNSGALGPAYSLTDMLDELGSESTSGVTSPVPSEDLVDSPTHRPVPATSTSRTEKQQDSACPTLHTTNPQAHHHQGQPADGKVVEGGGDIAEGPPPAGGDNKDSTSRNADQVITATLSQVGVAAEGTQERTSTVREKNSEPSKDTESHGEAEMKLPQAGAADSLCTSGVNSDSFTESAGQTQTKTATMKKDMENDPSVAIGTPGYSDMNGNGKAGDELNGDKVDGEEVDSGECSDEGAIDTSNKEDPVWRRKKVIKRKRPKSQTITSQTSTGSGESEGSTSSIADATNGLTLNIPENELLNTSSGSSPEVPGKSLLNDPNASNGVLTDNASAANRAGNGLQDLAGQIKEDASNDTNSQATAVRPSRSANDADPNSGYEPYEFPTSRNNINNNSHSSGPGDIYERVPDSALYENVASRSDPRRSTLRRGATLKGAMKGLSQEDLVSMTYQGSMKVVKVLPDQHPSEPAHTVLQDETRGGGDQTIRTRTPDGIYETLYLPNAPLSPLTPPVRDDEYDDFSWGSSEFESYDEEELPQEGAQEPISVTVEVKSRASQEPSNQNVLNKLAAKIGPRSWSREESDDQDASGTYLEVTLNMEKHPPPELPPFPPDLTPQQVKRRHIVASIVESERSYTDSLRRIIDEYEKPLLLAKPQIISKNHIKVIFYRMRDILQCHNMFHIELAEYIRVWDTQEKLGNVFTASFSKSMVFDAYSEFVNNFTLAMETAKKLAKQKQAFADFLKLKVQNSTDKLSLFGLMVKPIQRFPQFILCLQDLLKHTSHEHHDRLALQLALTELETLTHKLNEMKRESENRHEVKKIQSAMTGSRFSLKHDNQRCLVRQDDMVQMACHAGSTKSKSRRLFLMNDQLVCTTVVQKSPKPPVDRDSETGLAEKFKFKWSIPVRDVEVVEAEMPDLYQVKGGPAGRGLIVAPKLDKSNVSPWKKELDNMMHDLAVIEQLTNLTMQLRLNYPGLNPDLLFGIQRGLQLAIQDQGDVDLCILHLSLPTKYLKTSTDKIKDEMSKHIPHRTRPIRTSRMLHTFQVQSASIKQDWLLDLKNAKLSLDPNNKPGWYVPETDQGHCLRLPLFVKPLLIDITKQETKIQCAIAVVLPSYTNPYIGVQHLWVCSNEARHGQVTIVSLHTSQPHVLESFTACDAAIVCAEYVPGYSASIDHQHAFPQHTVWMAMESRELCVRNVAEEERSEDPLLVFDTDGDVVCLRFMDSRLYAGLADGRLALYNRDKDGVWHIEDRVLVDLGVSSINALLPLNHHMWVACDNKVHVVHVTTRWRGGSLHHDVKTSSHEVGSQEEEVLCMVKAGVGLMVSFRRRGVIRIYHQETFNHLQDVNVASAVAKVLEGKDLGDLRIQPRQVSITFMLASKGLLWIGTDCGCTLTLPLPRLEGVPQIKGRPSVSYHAHLAAIRFIVPISCGPCQLQGPPTSPLSNHSQVGGAHSENEVEDQSEADPNSHQQVSDSDVHSERGDRPASIITIEGATESDTNCDESSMDGEEHVFPPLDNTMDNNTEISSHTDGQPMQKGRPDYLSSSMLNLPQQGTINRTKWTSTPDLRHGSTINLNDSEEDVINLYNNLLQGAEYSKYDDALFMGGKRRRPQSEMSYPAMLSQDDPRFAAGPRSMMGLRTNRRASKYATLPIVVEDSPSAHSNATDREAIHESNSREGSAEHSFSTESGGDISPDVQNIINEQVQAEMMMSHHNASSMSQRPVSRAASTYSSHHAPLCPTQSTIGRLNPSQKSLSKSFIIVTGGEGHINWAEKNAGDNKYDDICLLLWQCRV